MIILVPGFPDSCPFTSDHAFAFALPGGLLDLQLITCVPSLTGHALIFSLPGVCLDRPLISCAPTYLLAKTILSVQTLASGVVLSGPIFPVAQHAVTQAPS